MADHCSHNGPLGLEKLESPAEEAKDRLVKPFSRQCVYRARLKKVLSAGDGIGCVINWVVRALNVDWLKALYHGYEKTYIYILLL